jgi:GAF domain-containing protein
MQCEARVLGYNCYTSLKNSDLESQARPSKLTKMESSSSSQNTIDRDKEVNLLSTEVIGYTSEVESKYEVDVERLNNWFKELFERSQHGINYQNYVEELLTFTSSIYKVQEYVWDSYFDSSISIKSSYLNNAMKLIHECLKAQVCSVFLIDKYGFLARRAFYGVDFSGSEIEPEWFADERYEINKSSFVGRTACIDPDGNSQYGTIQYTHDLEKLEQIDNKSLNAYKTRLGNPIGRAISVPINNRNGTIGVLRILNYYDPNPSIGVVIAPHKSKLNDRDVIWLSLFSSQISNTIIEYERVFNRRLFSKIISYANTKPNQPTMGSWKGVSRFLDELLEVLILNESNPFVFGIIRVINQDSNLVVVAKAAFDNLSFVNRVDTPISRHNSNNFVNLALNSGRYIIIPNIVESLAQFNNKEWVADQSFTTFCCFPLLFQGVPLGTLSLYTARKFSYDSHCIEYLQTIADTLSLYLYIYRDSELFCFATPPDKGLRNQASIKKTAKEMAEWTFRTIKPPEGHGRFTPEQIMTAVRKASEKYNNTP